MSSNGLKSLLSEESGEPLPKHLPQLHQLLDSAAQTDLEKIAVVSRHQASDLYAFIHEDRRRSKEPHLRWTYRSLRRAAHALARSLQYHGVKKGMTIATVVQNGIEWVLVVYASVLLGATVAPMSSRTFINSSEAAHMLKISDAKVIIAGDSFIGNTIDQLIVDFNLHPDLKILVDLVDRPRGWIEFSSLLDPEAPDKKDFQYSSAQHEEDDICLIAFTSGTTSLPKGCPMKNKAIQTTLYGLKRQTKIDKTSVSCMVMPNNHLMGFFHLFSYPSAGGTIVFPASAFDAPAVLTAFKEDRCTNFVCVPTMLHALLDRMLNTKQEFTHLRQVDIGGAAVSPRNVRQVIYSLGSKSVGLSFGMTEGTPIRSLGATNPEDLIRGDTIICGHPLAGVRVRICDPETRGVVKRGEYGELHQSGDHVIDNYLGHENPKSFYIDETGTQWFCSGDQAVMDDNGNVSIVGRYKDMIIRGGENISPAVIERVLNQMDGVYAQVVGAKDEIAGEVPVAVYQARNVVSVKDMQDSVLKNLGSTYLPTEFLSLQDLSIDEFPKTVSGKVQKPKLASLVHDYLQGQNPPEVNGYHKSTGDIIRSIWSSLLGIPADKLNLKSPVDDFADSITLMRFRDKVKKQTGKNISLDDIISHDSISAQIHLIESRNAESGERRAPFLVDRQGPPTTNDMIHTSGDEELMEQTKRLVEDTINPHGFTWDDDVEDVIPAYDYINVQFTQQRSISHNRRHAAVTSSHDVKALNEGLVAALSKHSTLRSFFVRENVGTSNEQAFYITMRPNDRWFQKAIKEEGEIKSIAALKEFASDNVSLDHSFPGPLFQAVIFHIEETGTAGFAYNANHVTFDAMSVRLFFEDLDKALSAQKPHLESHIPFKFWADTYYSLRESLAAQRSVKWHAQRLKSIDTHLKALFPAQRAPRWFLGPTRGWEPTAADLNKGYSNVNRECLSQPSSYDTSGITWRGELPSLKKLRDSVPQLTNPAIAKAALAMVNVFYTKHSHALFACVEAARGFLPFVPDHIAAQMDQVNCADVSGPCFGFVADLVEVKRDEPLSQFLARVQQGQTDLTRNAHAPIRSIVEGLGTNAEGTASGDVLLEVFRRQLFNWAPGVGNAGASPHENVRQVLGNSQSDNGLVFNAGVGGSDGTTCTLNVRWDDANTTHEEAEDMIQNLAKIVTWITEGGSYDRPVGDFIECL